MEKLARFLVTKEAVDSFFKLISYIAASALIFELAKFAFAKEGWYVGLPLLLLFFFSITLSFFYGLQTLIFPAGNAIWPAVNYMDTINSMQQYDKTQRLRVVKKILTTKPAVFLLSCYFLLFFALNEFLKVLIEKSFNA